MVIYHELLLADGVYGITNHSYNLQPAILRVNKEIHAESFSVLYQKNQWVLFTCFSERFVTGLTDFGYHIIPMNLALHGRLASKFALRLQIIKLQRTSQINGYSYMLHSHRLHRICTSLAPMDWEGKEIFITVNAPIHMQDNLLEAFRDIREVQKVSIVGADAVAPTIALTELMMTPIHHMTDILIRAKEYECRAGRELAIGHPRTARRIYYDGINYVKCAQRNIRSDRWRLGGGTRGIINRSKLNNIKSACFSGVAFCCLRERDWAGVHRALVEVIKRPGTSRLERARALYCRGLSLVATHKDDHSIICFMLAITLRPGYEAADHELDALEARYAEGSYTGLIFGSHVEAFLARLRHQPKDMIVERSVPRIVHPTSFLIRAISWFMMELVKLGVSMTVEY